MYIYFGNVKIVSADITEAKNGKIKSTLKQIVQS